MEKAGKQENQSDLKQIAKIASGLSEYNQTVTKFAVHRYLIDACMKLFAEEKITELSEIEQMILTGFDTEKKEYKESEIIEKILKKIDSLTNPKEKVRLAMITIVGIQLSNVDRKRLTDLLPAELALALGKLSAFGISIQDSGKTKKKLEKAEISALLAKIPQIKKIFNYAVPKIVDIIKFAIHGNLVTNGFTFGRSAPLDIDEIDPPAVQSIRKKKVNLNRTKRKIIIFVLGGVSYSEIRVVKEFPEYQIVVGGSRVFSPLEFVEEILEMSKQNEVPDLDPRDIELDFR